MSEPAGVAAAGVRSEEAAPSRTGPAALPRRSAWERWQMGTVAPANEAIETERTSPALYSANGRTALHQPVQAGSKPGSAPVSQAHAEAFAKGWAEGLGKGIAQGRAEGFAQGLADGTAQGLVQGQAEGRAAAQTQIDTELAQPLRALLHTLPQAWQQAEQAVAQDLLALAFALAQRVLGESLAVAPEGMLAAVRDLLNTEPPLTGHPKLWLHPQDAALVQTHLAEALHTAGWTLRPDPLQARGGCRVMAASGELDASLATRWSLLAAQLEIPPSVPAFTPSPLGRGQG